MTNTAVRYSKMINVQVILQEAALTGFLGLECMVVLHWAILVGGRLIDYDALRVMVLAECCAVCFSEPGVLLS